MDPSPDSNSNVNKNVDSNDSNLTHVHTQFIFNVDDSNFDQGGVAIDKACPMPVGDEKNEVANEQDPKKCNCNSIDCQCTCRKCDGPPHYEYAPRELPKGIKHKVRLCRPAFVMYLSGVTEGGEVDFTVPSMNLNKSMAHYLTVSVNPKCDGSPQNSSVSYTHLRAHET